MKINNPYILHVIIGSIFFIIFTCLLGHKVLLLLMLVVAIVLAILLIKNLSKLFNNTRIILIAKIVIICFVSLLAYISFVNISQKSMVASIFNLKNIVQVDASFAGTKNIEKLYTSNSIVVLEDLKTKNNEEDGPLIGVCTRRYEVNIGYDDVSKLFDNATVMQNVCKGDYSSLPKPEILAVNNVNQDIKGNFSIDDDCFKYETDPEHRKNAIRLLLLRHHVLNVNESKKKLQTFLSMDCPIDTSNITN